MRVHYTKLEEWKRNNPDKEWRKALLKIHYLELPSGMRCLWKEGDWNCHGSEFQLGELDRYNKRDYYSTCERGGDATVGLIRNEETKRRYLKVMNYIKEQREQREQREMFTKWTVPLKSMTRWRKRKVDNGHTNKMDGG